MSPYAINPCISYLISPHIGSQLALDASTMHIAKLIGSDRPMNLALLL